MGRCRCPKCRGMYVPTDADLEALAASGMVPLCPGCRVARFFRVCLAVAVLLIALGALLSLTGCAVAPGAWGGGPSSDGVTDEVHGTAGTGDRDPVSGKDNVREPSRDSGARSPQEIEAQAEIEKIKRERGAAKVSQREAERALQRMIGSR